MSIIYNETEIESIKYGDINVDSVFFSNTEVFSTSFNWPSSGNIPEATFLAGINSGSYDASLVGRYVTLAVTYPIGTHNWLIVRVNEDSYDLWYKGDIANNGGGWNASSGDIRIWTNNSTTDTNHKIVRALCTQYKSKLSSSIQAKLKTGLNANCGSDTVVILSAKQLGYTGSYIGNDGNSAIPYFNSDSIRSISREYWTTSFYSKASGFLWYVKSDGTFNYGYANSNYYHVVPAIRVG